MLSSSGWAEVPCAKCGTRVAGLEWNAFCSECQRERKRRANRLSMIISLSATALTAAYVSFRLPASQMSRMYAIVLLVATYIIIRRIATRVAMEFLPR